jgi:hypothetical protein
VGRRRGRARSSSADNRADGKARRDTAPSRPAVVMAAAAAVIPTIHLNVLQA